MTGRPLPFDLVFGALAGERFPAIRAAIGDDPPLDTFLMSEAAITLLRDLRPDEGLGGESDDFVALVYAAYRFWSAGAPTEVLDAERTRSLCQAAGTSSRAVRRSLPDGSRYIQVAPRLIWGDLDGTGQHEPLDGWFSIPTASGVLVVALFGVHAERPGLSVVSVEGLPPANGSDPRPDGTPAFAPTMAGGDRADLHAVATLGELLVLAWRVLDGGKE